MDAVPPPALINANAGNSPFDEIIAANRNAISAMDAAAAALTPKSIFRSRTALLGLLTGLAGLIGTVWPDANAFLATHADVILLAAGILQVVLRMATHGRVVLFGADGS